MSRILRIMVMWLLALAVPVQGFAAASMVGCMAGHGGAGLHSHAIGMHHHSVELPQHSHEGHAHVLAHADHRHASDANHDVHAGGTFTKASCSACASCCTSAALPTALLVFEAMDAPDSFVSLAPQPVATFVSGGPERPPRPFLA